jgi:hypothetical protein
MLNGEIIDLILNGKTFDLTFSESQSSMARSPSLIALGHMRKYE